MERPNAGVSGFIKRDNKYLVVYDPRWNENGFWRVPGGRLESEEKAEDALKREIKEELGLDINVKRFLGFGQDNLLIKKDKQKASRMILFFECGCISGEPKVDNYEATELRWVTLEEMKRLEPLEPALIDFFKRFKVK